MNLDQFIDQALQEDLQDPDHIIPRGDHTSLACITENIQNVAQLIVKDKGIIAGVELAKKIFFKVDPSLVFDEHISDGTAVDFGDIAFHVKGDAKSILVGERLVLNFMQRMSGISSITRKYVDLTKNTNAKILDTRKTTPTLRYFEKWAVKIGGGHNHRFGLYDMVMIKDNHIDFCGGIEKAILAVKKYQEKNNLTLRVEVETRSLEDVKRVLEVGNVQRIMLDNFTPDLVADAVKLIAGIVETEASGGINLETVRSFAETNVDFISVGALTHSAGSLDLSLKAV